MNLPVQAGPTKALDKCKYCHSEWQYWKKYFLKQFLTLIPEKKTQNLLHFKFTEHPNVLKTFTLIFIASIRYISILYQWIFNAIVVRAKTNRPSRKQNQCQTKMIFLKEVSKFAEENSLSRLCHLQQQERNTLIKLCFVLFEQSF